MKVVPIGSLSKGVDGSDSYFLVTLEDGDLVDDPAEQLSLVEAEMLKLFYREGSVAGGYYCSHVDVLPHGDNFVLVVQHRYDV